MMEDVLCIIYVLRIQIEINFPDEWQPILL